MEALLTWSILSDLVLLLSRCALWPSVARILYSLTLLFPWLNSSPPVQLAPSAVPGLQYYLYVLAMWAIGNAIGCGQCLTLHQCRGEKYANEWGRGEAIASIYVFKKVKRFTTAIK